MRQGELYKRCVRLIFLVVKAGQNIKRVSCYFMNLKKRVSVLTHDVICSADTMTAVFKLSWFKTCGGNMHSLIIRR